MGGLAWVDWALLAIVVVSTLISIKRGFFKEAFSLFVMLASVVLSLMFHEQAATLLVDHIASPSLRKLAGFGSLFILCMLMGGLLRVLISQLVKLTGLSGTDRLLGMVFGALRGVVVVVILLIAGQRMLPLNQETWWQESVLIPHFLRLESWIVAAAYGLRDFMTALF